MDLSSLIAIIMIIVLLFIFPEKWAIAIEDKFYNMLFAKKRDRSSWMGFFIGAIIFICLNLFFQINIILQIIFVCIIFWLIPRSS